MNHDDRPMQDTEEHPYFTAIKKLPSPWREHFPQTREDCSDWQEGYWYVALHQKVIIAAKTRMTGHWKAYCMNVPGISHDHEWRDVLRHGDELTERWARAFFPHLDPVPYAD